MSLGARCKHCNKKPPRIFRFINGIVTALRHPGLKIPGEDRRASVGVAHIDLIEHVIECLPIVHLAIQTAREQAAHTKPAFDTACRSTSRAVEGLMQRDRNRTAIHWNFKNIELQSYNFDAASVFSYVSPGTGGGSSRNVALNLLIARCLQRDFRIL